MSEARKRSHGPRAPRERRTFAHGWRADGCPFLKPAGLPLKEPNFRRLERCARVGVDARSSEAWGAPVLRLSSWTSTTPAATGSGDADSKEWSGGRRRRGRQARCDGTSELRRRSLPRVKRRRGPSVIRRGPARKVEADLIVVGRPRPRL